MLGVRNSCKNNNGNIAGARGQSGLMGFCKESIRDGRFGRACMRRLVDT
jgi:hypothetical protein